MAPALSRCMALSRVLCFPATPAIYRTIFPCPSSSFVFPKAVPPCRFVVFTESQRWIHLSRISQGIVTFKLADIGEGIAEVEILRWFRTVGDEISEMEEVCEVQSDKAAVEITSRYSGNIKKLYHNVGDIVKIGDPLVDILVEDDSASQEVITTSETTSTDFSATSSSTQRSKSDLSAENNDLRASPATRRLAKELGVNLADVIGTGKDGRISKSDIEDYLKKGKETISKPSIEVESETPVVPPQSRTLENAEVLIRGSARTMVKTMTESVKVPHLHIGEEIDITDLLRMRKSMKLAAEKQGLKLTITPLLIKAISCALLKFPILNSKIDPSGEKYTIFGSHNISIAMDAPNGLIVPNIKNVQDLSILQIQSELSRLQDLAQKSKLNNADLTGGTISLSNVGIIGGTLVKALLFDGQAMIIAVGKTQRLPRFNSEDDLVARDIVNLGFSADHRHCDGATVARFSSELKSYLENPELLLMNLS